ncbi:MAG: DNA polymerase IV [Clostridia bacterium]|nr:DNA polymerase IV [Clostridia bacterium]
MRRVIFHIDVNSAFLSWTSVERLKNGESDLRTVPAVISGSPGKRTSVVLAKSIPAKKYGIQTGEPIGLALRKCPGLAVAPPSFRLYAAASRAFKAICDDFSPLRESFSIDECFLDMSGMERLYPNILDAAYKLKDRIKNELGFTVNVGVGSNKLLAKMASDFEKPDKVHTLFSEEVETKLWPLPVRDLLFLGRSTAEKLERFSIRTVGDLARADLSLLRAQVGKKMSEQLHFYANGIDPSPVVTASPAAKSYSHSITVEDDVTDFETADALLLSLSDAAAARMRDDAKCACSIAIVLRDTRFQSKSHQTKLDVPTDVTKEIYQTTRQLLRAHWAGTPLRLIGVALSELTDRGEEQLTLFGSRPAANQKQQRVDAAMDAIRFKFGEGTLIRGATLGVRHPKLHAPEDGDFPGEKK